MSTMFGVPFTACDMIGSALGLVAARVIGAAPTSTTTTAPRAANIRSR